MITAPLNSAFYQGWLRHRRNRPKAHVFRYRVGLLYLDLSETEIVFSLSRLFSRCRFAPLSFREIDYLPHLTRQGWSLREAVQQTLKEASGEAIKGRICLLTQPRCWGLSFSQVNFYYCHDDKGRLAAILTEVCNTPWGERYQYVLPAQNTNHQHFAVAKSLHVSPFLPMDLEYHLHFTTPDRSLGVHMEDHDSEGKIFDATLSLERHELNARAIHHYLMRFPWMSAKSLVAIYWQALRLACKGLPFFGHHPAKGRFRIGRQTKESRHGSD